MTTQYSIDINELVHCTLDRAYDLNIKLSEKTTIGEVIDKLIKIGVIVENNNKITDRDSYETSENENETENENSDSKESKKGSSGFCKPILWSDEMYEFLESFKIIKGTLVSRVKVTMYVEQYIKTNNLNVERYIHPDEKLKNLLKYDESHGQLSYFNLQRYLSKHVLKETTPSL